MATSLKQLLAACALALAAAGVCAPASAASDHASHPKAAVPKKQAKHKKTKKAEPQIASDDEPEADIAGLPATDYSCELNNKVTIYTNAQDDTHISLRWKNHLQRLSRVGTTTGAQRFENEKTGLVWIGIPSKGMLLDAKHGHQLANECKNAEQSEKKS
jgi:hypothetical protein